MSDFIISRAHEVVQGLPLSAKRYVCTKCGLKGSIDDLFGKVRCTPTVYRMSSGWRDESTPEERMYLDGFR